MKKLAIIAALMLTSMTYSAFTHARLQHRYERDAEGRLATRTAYAWNGQEWQPALRWTYVYTPTGYTCEFACYDLSRSRFSETLEKTIYTFTPDGTAAYVTTYMRRDDSAPYELTDSMLAVYPDKSLLDFIAKNNKR